MHLDNSIEKKDLLLLFFLIQRHEPLMRQHFKGRRGEGLSKIRRMPFRTIPVRDISANIQETVKQIRYNGKRNKNAVMSCRGMTIKIKRLRKR